MTPASTSATTPWWSPREVSSGLGARRRCGEWRERCLPVRQLVPQERVQYHEKQDVDGEARQRGQLLLIEGEDVRQKDGDDHRALEPEERGQAGAEQADDAD